jgi:DNA-binding response OmpR family regulator
MTNKSMARILIVEDDTPLAMMVVSLLTRAGCDTLVARTGEKGMELAFKQKFDLITLDVDLPDMNGFEICRELKQRHLSCHTPIVFVSGRASDEDRKRAHELGAVDFIEKPFGVEIVSRLVSHVKKAPVA